MKLHYSLYRTQHEESDTATIDLSQVTSIELGLYGDTIRIGMRDSATDFSLNITEYESFLTAWNIYKYASSAAKLVKIPDITNPTIACNSAIRLDEYLGFLAGEKLKELAEMGGQS
jgi:hypothetical protein